MKFKIIFYIFFFILNLIFFDSSSSNNYPANPSSVYKSEYFGKKKIKTKKIDEQRSFKINADINKSNIVVKGNFRIDSEVVIRDSKILSYKKIESKIFNQCVKNLYATGFYSDVKIYKNKDLIVIDVNENPVINKIAFEGNSEIDDETISSEVLSKARDIYSITKVKSDVIKIQTLYKRLGYFSTYIEPKIINVGQNRVNLVFEIYEGVEATVKKINFIGNKEFSDSTLRDVIFSEESRWYKFWSSGDKFDQEKIDYDKDLLRKYYLDNGYVDFRVLSANSQLVYDRKNFIVNFKIYEGKRYRISNINFEIANKELLKLNFFEYIELKEGDWFSSKDIEKDIEKITNVANEYGFAFTDVRPKLQKKLGKVSLTFVIFESEKIYVQRVNIKGNIKTHDKVVRREIEFDEGDAFNLTKIKRTESNLNKLGLFSSVKVDYEPIPKSNQTNLNVEVEETSTGQFSVGAGYSSLDGALGTVAIKESNLLGEGKELALNLELATRKNSIDLSFTEPYFLERDIAAGIDVFNIRNNLKTYSGYKHNTIGFKLRNGYEIFDDLRHFSSYTLKRDKIHDIDPSTSIYIKSQEGKTVTSMIGQALQFDKLNDRLNPTDGYRLRFDLDYYGIGGDTNHLTAEFRAVKFTKLFKGVFIGNFFDLGYILELDKPLRINNRFILSGEQLRGFKNSGLGPRDISTDDALGGEQYFVSRNEIHFPVGLPESLGLSGIAFADIGSLFAASESSSTVKDDLNLRASAGLGIAWSSPFGPVRVYLSKAILKETYDKNETFRFTFGTTY